MRQQNSITDIRAAVSAIPTHSLLSLGLAYAIAMLAFFSLCFCFSLLLENLWARLFWGILTGIAISGLILIGHDGAHQSLTPHRILNNAIARLALGFSAHPLAGWQVEHNRLHHRWTNLRGKDCVLVPPSPQDWSEWPWYKQRLFSLTYRWWGVGLHYLARVWWPCTIRLKPELKAELVSLTQHRFDLLFVIALFIGQVSIIVFYLQSQGQLSVSAFSLSVFYVIVLPFFVWSWLIGYVSLTQHTHPHIPWFDNEDEWDYVQAQLNQSPHMTMPVFLDRLSMHIMDHTAHHCFPAVPSYHLQEVQSALEVKFPDKVIVQQSSLSHLLSILRVCQLYDYEGHCWLRFNGELATDDSLPGPPV